MIAHIQSETACPIGLRIIGDKFEALTAHNHAAVIAADIREAAHLEACPICNGQQSAAMIEELFPGARVAE